MSKLARAKGCKIGRNMEKCALCRLRRKRIEHKIGHFIKYNLSKLLTVDERAIKIIAFKKMQEARKKA